MRKPETRGGGGGGDVRKTVQTRRVPVLAPITGHTRHTASDEQKHIRGNHRPNVDPNIIIRSRQ